jgi:hypothetical protein
VSIALRVDRGQPDDAEIAALMVVLGALAAGAVAEPESAPSNWADPAWRTGAPGRLGPAAWRLAGLPR